MYPADYSRVRTNPVNGLNGEFWENLIGILIFSTVIIDFDIFLNLKLIFVL